MNRKLCAPADRARSWESIDWKKAEAYVKKLQMRIVKARDRRSLQQSENSAMAVDALFLCQGIGSETCDK